MRARCCCTPSVTGPGPGILAAAGGEPGEVALLSAVSLCFALGAATIEQFKHLAAADAGPLAGLGALPDLRTIRPKLAAIADGTDRLRCSACSPPRCWPRTWFCPGCITSMTTLSPTPALSRGQGLEIQARPGREGPRRHPRDRA